MSKNKKIQNPSVDYGNKIEKPPQNWLHLIFALFAIIISGIAAYYSSRQAEIAEDVSHRQLRAYLDLKQGESRAGVNEIFVVDFGLRNYGQTPAKMVQVDGQIEILPFPLPENFVPEYSEITQFEQNCIVFPGENTLRGSIPSKHLFTQQNLSEMGFVNSNKRIYMFVRLSYRDCFDFAHHTWFCKFFDPHQIKSLNDSTFRATWAIYGKYNDFD